MATYLTPSPHIYENTNAASSQEYCQSYTDFYAQTSSRYYPHAEERPAEYLLDAHALSAVSTNNQQASGSHPLYADANAAVTSYTTTTHATHDRWTQPTQPHLQTRYSDMQPRPACDGDVSPVSDDSLGTWYDSPQPYEHAQLVDAYTHSYYEQVPAPLAFSNEDYSPAFEYGQDSPVAFDDAKTHGHSLFAHGYSGNSLQGSEPHTHSELFSVDTISGGSRQRFPSQYLAKQEQFDAPMQTFRSGSPMGHLPYQCPDPYSGMTEGYSSSRSYESSDTSRHSSIERPQPRYPSSASALPLLAHPTPISIPAPRSPPIVEDMPKKPLTLACFFCRKRKIACGSPPPGKTDRTCNQCARRNLRCEYPVNSRRGTRQRELETLSYSA